LPEYQCVEKLIPIPEFVPIASFSFSFAHDPYLTLQCNIST
jgi:hypothetical protein